MINAGSLVVCSLLKPELSMSKKFLYASQQFSEFAGGARIGFDNSVFLSEKDSADRNFALAYYMVCYSFFFLLLFCYRKKITFFLLVS